MPRSPRVPPRAPIDRVTFEAASSGDARARQELAVALGWVVDRVLAKRSQPDAKRQHDLALGVWRHLLDDGLGVLRQWDSGSSSFEQHVTDVVVTWLDDATSRDSTAIAWTPALVSTALDVGGELKEQLARDVLAILRRCANQALFSRDRGNDRVVTPDDLAQEFAARLFDKGGAILRSWEPGRGRTSLASYLSFIGRRHFNLMIRRDDKVVGIHQRSQELAPPPPEPAAALIQALMLEAVRAQLDDKELELLEMVRLGVSVAQGAERLGIEPNNFSQRKFRLVKRLKEIMKKLDDEHQG